MAISGIRRKHACEKRQYTCEKVIRFRQFIGCAGIIFTHYSAEAHTAFLCGLPGLIVRGQGWL